MANTKFTKLQRMATQKTDVTFGTPLLPGIARDANVSRRLEECDGEEGEMAENMGSGLRMK